MSPGRRAKVLISRRQVFASLLGISVLSRIGSSSLGAVPVLVVLQAAAAVAGVISAFMRSDGGMGAILSALNQKLDLVIQQLVVVQLALADIVKRLNELPDEIDELLKAQFVTEQIAKMRASMAQFLEIQQSMDARRRSGLAPSDANVQEELKELYKRFDDARRTLRASPAGMRPDTALFAPAAFTFDLAINLASSVTNERLIELVRGYKKWFEDIVDPRVPNSTAASISAALKRHDAAVEAIASTHIGNVLGFHPEVTISEGGPIRIGNLTLNAPGLSGVLVHTPPIVPSLDAPRNVVANCFDRTRITLVTIGFGGSPNSPSPPPATIQIPIGTHGLRVSMRLRGETLKLSEQFAVRLIRYDVFEQSHSWPNEMRPSNVPTPNECQLVAERTFGEQLEAEIRQSDAWRRHLDDLQKFKLNVDEANGERLRIGAYSAIATAAADARTAADRWLSRLGA